jgi:hypothetical protein
LCLIAALIPAIFLTGVSTLCFAITFLAWHKSKEYIERNFKFLWRPKIFRLLKDNVK